ncbi:MAG: outer membrane protein transport protein [Myxococcales bacterium]|nr:outer membrane protein transport protein [Myxococcales bacterium]
MNTRRVLPMLLLALASLAHADEVHDQTFLVGERALGMGGAATGVADEPSAVYYNPAGLVLVPGDALAANLSINAYDRRVVEDGYGSPIGTRDLRTTSRPGVPLFASTVKRFGRRLDNGERAHAFAFSTVTPSQVRLRWEVDVDDPSTGVSESLFVEHERRVTFLGPSLGLRLRDDLAIGLSAFLVSTRLRHREDSTVVTDVRFDPELGVYRNDTLSVRETRANVLTRHALFRLGVMWMPKQAWRIGLMFQPPGLELTDRASLRDRRSFADLLASPPYATYSLTEAKGLSAAQPIPWELRVGASWAPSDALTLALDVSTYGRVRRAQVFGTPEADPLTGAVPQPGDYVVQTTRRRTNVNVSFGVEAVVANKVPLRFGFFTDRSAAPDVPAQTDVYTHPQVNRYGASFSVGYRSERYDVSVGTAVLYGRGDALRTNPFGPDDPTSTYLRADARERAVYFFLSGARQAASRYARTVYQEQVRPWMRGDGNEGETNEGTEVSTPVAEPDEPTSEAPEAEPGESPTEAAPAEAAPTEAAPTEAAPTEAAPAEVAPAEAVPEG